MSIILTDRELEQLAEIEQQEAISDEVMRLKPYDFILRNGLVLHDFSRRFPVPPSVEGFISLPRNVLVITDAGRQQCHSFVGHSCSFDFPVHLIPSFVWVLLIGSGNNIVQNFRYCQY